MAMRKIQHDAGKKRTLTLDEVAAFVQDAMRSGATGAEIVGVQVSLGGKLRKIGCDVDVAKSQVAHDG